MGFDMIISHEKEFAYFRSPKTGTTSAMFYLRSCGGLTDKDIVSGMPGFDLPPVNLPVPQFPARQAHMTPATAVAEGLITVEQLKRYNSFCVIREPYDKMLSSFIHIVRRYCNPSSINSAINSKDGEEVLIKKAGLLFTQQANWFKVDGELVVQPLLMEDYEINLRGMIKLIGGVSPPVMPSLNSRKETRYNHTEEEWMTTDFVRFVDAHFQEDFELYNQANQKGVHL